MAPSRSTLFCSLVTSILSLSFAHAQENIQTTLQRGSYLAAASDCTACHAAPDRKNQFSGGTSIQTPIGAIIAPNITPSQKSGIGLYSEQDFSRALRNGIRRDGAPLYPAMPYPAFRNLSDDDVHALYVYFMKGVDPVDNIVAPTKLPFPFNIRTLMNGWNFLYLSSGAPVADPSKSADYNRGRYLVEGPAHCGTCHTPRDRFMGEQLSASLSGTYLGSWHVPNITPDPVSGIGNWTVGEIVSYLKTGQATGKASAAGGMGEVVQHNTSKLLDSDLHAIAVYLKSVPAVHNPADVTQRSGFTARNLPDVVDLEAPVERTADNLRNSTTLDGATLYNGACATCHGQKGQGTPDGTFPSLDHNSTTGSRYPNNLIMVISDGIHRNAGGKDALMPAFTPNLSNGQIAAVANYVFKTFGNPATATVTEAQVEKLRHDQLQMPLSVSFIRALLVIGMITVALFFAGIIILILRRRATRVTS